MSGSESPVEAINSGDPVAIISTLLGTRMSERARKLLTAYVVGAAAYSYGNKLWKKYHKSVTFTVSVSDKDEIYSHIQQWLLDLIPADKRMSLAAHSGGHRRSYFTDEVDEAETIPASDERRPKEKLRDHLHLVYDGSKDQTVTLNGHEIVVSVGSPERPSDSTEEAWRSWMNGSRKITFSAKNQAGRDAVVAFLDRIAAKCHSVERVPNFYLSTSWGEWSRRNDLPRRDPSTIVLPDGQMERIIADLDKFLNSEEQYSKLGIPYHRGYLLEGPPGSGKTSIARGIATHFALDLHYLTLSDLDKDAKLLQMISGVGSGGMLLLEDVDVLNATHDRDKDDKSGDEKGRISLSGLLNGLDGVASPHGLVVFLTTNHVDRLDPALIRPGRVDMREHVGYLGFDQIERLFSLSFGYAPELPTDILLPDLVASTVVGILKQNMGDPDTALKSLCRLIEDAAFIQHGKKAAFPLETYSPRTNS